MNKHTLGLIFLIIAIVNIYWAARVSKLMNMRGSREEIAAHEKQAKKLNNLSRISYFLVSVVFLLYLIYWR